MKKVDIRTMNGEVLVPGGSLDHALWALEGGANAVYVGFQKFSARSHADNLSLEDMAALTAVAKQKNARVFCALNTILTPAEVAQAVSLAWELYFCGVDALIVQDLGLAKALQEHGPRLDLHASTQAAVHNPGGVAALKALGFCRVVLARELTMTEIGQIVEAEPDMEYEVFVHGALCYAVSGNCMASGLMLGRSANRGDCGQVCRTKFQLDYLIPGPKRKVSPHEEGLPEGIHAPPGEITWKQGASGAFASMNDLELGSRIRELRALGVQSFKIEGRMKPPAYSYNTARAYRAFLDGGRDQDAWDWLDEARLRFGRLPSAGWFDGHKALAQTNPEWAGTLGMPLGRVEGSEGTKIEVPTAARGSVFRTLGKGDGLMIIGTSPGQTFRGSLAGPVSSQGGRTFLALAEKPNFEPRGGSLWLLSRHDGKLPVKKAGRPWRHPLPIEVMIDLGDAPGSIQMTVSTPSFGAVSFHETLLAEPSTANGGFEASVREIFLATDCRFSAAPLSVVNRAGPIFVSPKHLKVTRRRWYALLEERCAQWVADRETLVLSEGQRRASQQSESKAPARVDLSPLQGVNRLTGFITEWESLKSDQLVSTEWGLALPLAPFTPGEESYFLRLKQFLDRLEAEVPGQKVFPGLSNPCHISWMHRLADEGYPISSWFADWGFHSANPWTPALLSEALPGFQFAVHWLEDPQCPDRSYFPPLFTSRACMLRNSFGQTPSMTPTPGDHDFDSRAWVQARLSGETLTRPQAGPRCPDGCAGHFSARLIQGKKAFRVEARDCTNYLILEGDPAASV